MVNIICFILTFCLVSILLCRKEINSLIKLYPDRILIGKIWNVICFKKSRTKEKDDLITKRCKVTGLDTSDTKVDGIHSISDYSSIPDIWKDPSNEVFTYYELPDPLKHKSDVYRVMFDSGIPSISLMERHTKGFYKVGKTNKWELISK